MRKRQRANRIVWIVGIMIVCGILAASAVVGNRFGDAIRAIKNISKYKTACRTGFSGGFML